MAQAVGTTAIRIVATVVSAGCGTWSTVLKAGAAIFGGKTATTVAANFVVGAFLVSTIIWAQYAFFKTSFAHTISARVLLAAGGMLHTIGITIGAKLAFIEGDVADSIPTSTVIPTVYTIVTAFTALRDAESIATKTPRSILALTFTLALAFALTLALAATATSANAIRAAIEARRAGAVGGTGKAVP